MIGHFFHNPPHNSSRIHRDLLLLTHAEYRNAPDTDRSIPLARPVDRFIENVDPAGREYTFVKQIREMMESDNHCRKLQ